MLLSGPFLMVFEPIEQSYFPQSFFAVSLSATGGMTLYNVTNVFVSTAVAREHQSLGQGIFNTLVQLGTAISLAIAATVAHAGGVTVDASIQELLNGYDACFWLCVGILTPPIVVCLFLKASIATHAGLNEPPQDFPQELPEKKPSNIEKTEQCK